MKTREFEFYKIILEEHRFLQELSWKIFAISSTILFAAPFALLETKNGYLEKSFVNLGIGILGLLITLCIFCILFNYRRRENILEERIIAIEKELKLRGLLDIRERIKNKPFISFLPFLPGELHENRWARGIIFLSLCLLYLIIIFSEIFLIVCHLSV